MTNLVQSADSINTVLADTVKGGDFVILNSGLFGVAVSDGDGTNLRTVKTKGVFTLAKATGAISQGAKVYWDATNKNVTTTSTSNTFIGYAWSKTVSADTTIEVGLSNGV